MAIEKDELLNIVGNIGTGIIGSYIVGAYSKSAAKAFKEDRPIGGVIDCAFGIFGLKLAAESIYNVASTKLIKNKFNKK